MSAIYPSLRDKKVVVTGARSGIGRAIALAFAGAGADVAIGYKRAADSKVDEVTRKIRDLGRRALAVQVDISKRADVEDLVNRVEREFGRIDVMVNNAAVFLLGGLLEFSQEDWDTTIGTILTGCYLCCQTVGKKMVAQGGGGNIINIVSRWAMSPSPEASAYCIAKVGVITLTNVLAQELAKYKIRVNAIAPGNTRTDMIAYIVNDPVLLKQEEARIPLGRIAEPEDIADTALFLASDASRHITGSVITVAGGLQ
ncbi:MAG: SDR family oxidoreductase [Chloroflexi bacterium]|nr:SDR family oxidoreductase [Chloroflexota bacterium]